MRARLRCACAALAGVFSLSCAAVDQSAAPVTDNHSTSNWAPRFGPWSESKEFVLSLRSQPNSRHFDACGSDQRLEVADGGDLVALRRAVESDSIGSERIVSFVGRDRLSSLPTDLMITEIIVDRFIAVWPEETCEKAGVHTTLDNTYWKLVELNGEPVTVHENQRETHVILRTQSNQLGGFAGCNTLTGRYEADGDRLRFIEVKSTETACEYLDEERAFIAALSRVTNYQSVGESLQLRDDTGPIARLRAVYFR